MPFARVDRSPDWAGAGRRPCRHAQHLGHLLPQRLPRQRAGWATSIAKIGSLAGPLVGGLILATAFPVRHIHALLAVSPAVLTVAILAMSLIHRRSAHRTPTLRPVPGTAQEAAG